MIAASDDKHRQNRLAFLIALVVLACCACQLGIGGARSKTGELLGLSVPISTLVLAAAAAVSAWRFRVVAPPRLHWAQALFLAAAAVGLLGLSRSQLKPAAKEAVQLGEIFVLAPFVFMLLARRAGLQYVRRAFALAWCLVLTLYVTGLGARLDLSDAKAAAMLAISLPMALAELRRLPGRRRMLIGVGAGLALGWAVHHPGFLLCWAVTALAFMAFAKLRLRDMRAPAVGLGICLLLSLLPVGRAGIIWGRFSPRFAGTHTRRSVLELVAAAHAPRQLPLGAGLGEYKRGINYLRLLEDDLPHPDDMKVPRDGNSQVALALVEAGLPAALALLVLLFAAVFSRGAEPVWRASAVGVLCAGLFAVVLSRGIGIWVGGILALALPAQRKSWSAYAPPAVAWVLGLACLVGYNRDLQRQDGLSRANLAVRRLLCGGESVITVSTVPPVPDGVAAPVLPPVTPSAPAPAPVAPAPAGDGGNGLMVLSFDDLSAASGAVSGPIRVEAEKYGEIVVPLKTAPFPDASGGQALVIPGNSGKGVGHAVYEVDIPQAGDYRLQASVFWQDGCGNSIRFATGDQSLVVSSDTYGRWHILTALRSLRLAQGKQRLTVHNVEDGVRLDYWQLDRVE